MDAPIDWYIVCKRCGSLWAEGYELCEVPLTPKTEMGVPVPYATSLRHYRVEGDDWIMDCPIEPPKTAAEAQTTDEQ